MITKKLLRNRQKTLFVVALIILLSIGVFFYKFLFPHKAKSYSAFTSASATLANARASFRAGIASGTSGSSLVTIDASGNADNDTDNLFPKDTVCFTDPGEDGCVGNVYYTVASIQAPDGQIFNTTAPLADTLSATGYAVASQSGVMTLAFTTTNTVPIGGNLLITIPAVNTAGKTNDGIPDTNSTAATNGWDLGGVVQGDVSISDVSGCTQSGWGSATVTAGNASVDHTISFTRSTTTCANAKAITVTIGGTHKLINPAPITSGHTQGTADTYQVRVQSRDSGNNVLDQSDLAVSPVEGVLVSATVDETLSLAVVGIGTTSGSYCGISRTASSPVTTATSIPWGTISSTYLAATHNAQQQLTVSTNATSGYSVYIEENDQMGKDGATCTGTAPSPGDYTFGSATCIRDTICGGGTPCSESAAQDWTDMATYVGLGFSLQDINGTDAFFDYDGKPAETSCTSGTFCARQIADITGSETRRVFMTNTGPVAASSVYACYRIAITAIQPAGYYYNKVQYTAVATF